METRILSINYIREAALIIKSGGLVAIPTETVYGLAANALNPVAVKKIFIAKGRPSDNPLIVHISDISEWDRLVKRIPDNARKLAKYFWPGPLTIILEKSKLIPDEVSAGLSTVAVRFPSHKVAREIIRQSGVPLAAPSANKSGLPSPTSASHVIDDMYGKIDAVLDGGACSVGVESTVINLSSDIPCLLRPGGITYEQLVDVLGEVVIDKAVCNCMENGEKPSSPGMKYKHYSPSAKVILIKGNRESYADYVNSYKGDMVYALCYNEDLELISIPHLNYADKEDLRGQAERIFSVLRGADDIGVKVILARCPSQEAEGLAVYNRLIRASGFGVIHLE